MTKDPNLIHEQQQRAYLLMAGGIVIMILSVASVLFFGASFAIVVAAVLPAAILFYFGFQSYSALSSGSLYPSKGRREAHLKAGQTAFWVLLGTIMIDDVFSILPEDHLHTSLIYIGILTLVVLLVYEYVQHDNSPPLRDES